MKKLWMPLVTASFILVGCANPNTLRGDVYTADQAKTARSVRYGTIVEAIPVQIQNKNTGLGGLTGAALGGVAGSTVGGGSGSILAGIAGGVAGLVVGDKIEQHVNLTSGVELTIRGDNGQDVVVVQKEDPKLIKGARVKIVGSGSSINVTPM